MAQSASDNVVNSYVQTHETRQPLRCGKSARSRPKGAVYPTNTLDAISLRGAEYLAKNWGSVLWGDRMKRRKIVTLVGGAAARWPLTAHAQRSAMPVIGFVQRSNPVRSDFANFPDGLKALGYEKGRTIWIEQRYAGADLPYQMHARGRT
jgi:hypothetical protein